MARLFRRVLLLAALFVVGAAAPAAAHTSLAESTPANGASLDQAPGEARLAFTNPIDPRTLTFELLLAGGEPVEGWRRLTPDRPDTKVVEYSLPELEDGSYGIAWRSVGSDGHTASGDLVFAVGTGGPAPAAASGLPEQESSRGADMAAGLGRFLWYAGLTLLGGGLWLLHALRSKDEPVVAVAARRWAQRGALVATVGAACRLGALMAAVAAGGGSALDGYVSRNGTLWTVAIFSTVAIARLVHHGRPVREPAAGLAGLAVLAGLAGHGGHGVLSTMVDAAHLLAAVAWVGPLGLVALMTLGSMRSLEREGRRRLVRHLFSRFAPLAAWSLAVLVATGVHMAWDRGGDNLLDTSYGWALVAKVALIVAVALPLGWHHDRLVRSWRTTEPGPAASFLRTVRVEAAALALVLVAAAVLTGLDPTSPQQPAAGAVLAEADTTSATAAIDTPDECAKAVVGQKTCYERYYIDLLKREGAEAAITALDQRQATDEVVRTDCHQLTHAVGRAAADVYDDLAEAFSFEASACWSGYYHGVMESMLSEYDDAELTAALPSICGPASEPRYAFGHYNCVHGMGHGVVLRYEGDLFRGLESCAVLNDPWERDSCAGGAFMQNIISAQEGGPASLRDDDLMYPCTAVDDVLKEGCYQMQTSHVLWKIEYDYAKGFALCDGVEAGYVDDCYRSMGRDVSGGFLLDPAKVVQTCGLGQPGNRVHCVVGAALNAVYDQHGTEKADELCGLVAVEDGRACQDAVAEASASL